MKYSVFYAISYVVVALFTLSSPRAEARGYGELGAHLSTERAEDASSTTPRVQSERHFRFDIATGWQSPIAETQLLSYGLVFKSERGFQNSSDLAGYGVGAFLGWFRGPLSVRFDYLFLAEQKANNGIVETSFREGAGFAFEIRWLQWFELSEGETKFAVGPTLAFTQMNYSKTRIGTLPESSATRTTEALNPGIRGIFIF